MWLGESGVACVDTADSNRVNELQNTKTGGGCHFSDKWDIKSLIE